MAISNCMAKTLEFVGWLPAFDIQICGYSGLGSLDEETLTPDFVNVQRR
jgi:hypothetical protein